MALELSEHEKKVVMAYELSEDESPAASFPCKRAQRDNGTTPSTSPRKRQTGVVGDQEVYTLMPQGSKLNVHGTALAVEDGTVASSGTAIVSGITEESLEWRDGRDSAGKIGGILTPEQGDIVLAPHWLQMIHDSSPTADATACGEKELETNHEMKHDSPPAADATASGEKELGTYHAPPGFKAKILEQADQDSDISATSDEESLIPKSIIQRQQNDPELREKIHQVETDWALGRTARDVYNEERFKLYTEEELKKAHILWPRREVRSPAGYRERELEYGNYINFEAGEYWDDMLFEFGCPFEEINYPGGDEEDAKKRLLDKIEENFKDPEARMAEHKRWEKIRKVEAKYYHNKISREKYNKRRFALYTEEERKEKSVVWPRDESEEECCSPAGYRCDVFRSYCLDMQTRMAFHCPFYESKYEQKCGEEILCELCIPLIEEDRILKIKQEREAQRKAEKKKEEREAQRKAEKKKEEEKAEKKKEEREAQRKAEKKKEEESRLAMKNGLFRCAACKRNFGSDIALKSHTAAKHKK